SIYVYNIINESFALSSFNALLYPVNAIALTKVKIQAANAVAHFIFLVYEFSLLYIFNFHIKKFHC
ncbi:hypothetical protein, partial [Escherichia coli]|uniref:hypothetical protein n=1 Tax=Escherichia coli TaxID=562 RepID=UPI00197A796B